MPAALRIVGDRAHVCHLDAVVRARRRDAGERSGGLPVFEQLGLPVVQAITSGMPREAWEVSHRGLTALDTAINVAIPEFDGRIITVPLSFKDRSEDAPGLYAPHASALERVAGLAAQARRVFRQRTCRARHAGRVRADQLVVQGVAGRQRRRAGRAGQPAHAAPRHAPRWLHAGRRLPATSDELMADLLACGTYDDHPPARSRTRPAVLAAPLSQPIRHAAAVVPQAHGGLVGNARRSRRHACAVRTGGSTRRSPRKPPAARRPSDEGTVDGRARLPVCGDDVRSRGGRPSAAARLRHEPGRDLPHARSAADAPLRGVLSMAGRARDDGGWGADAIVHVGKHGTLEWLPGKGVGLSGECFPDALLGDMPLIYPFIVNDPGEGSQAKRRGHARDRRSPDAADDVGRRLWAAGRTQRSGQRVLRSREAGCRRGCRSFSSRSGI